MSAVRLTAEERKARLDAAKAMAVDVVRTLPKELSTAGVVRTRACVKALERLARLQHSTDKTERRVLRRCESLLASAETLRTAPVEDCATFLEGARA